MHNVIAFANGKGGVGKTSLTANFAGLAAASGLRVLAADLDPQGNLGADLGYDQSGASDDGKELLDAIVRKRVPTPMPAVRPNLDVLAGGAALDELVPLLAGNPHNGRLTAVRNPLTALATNYDLVVLDCPPTGGIILQAMLAAATFVVVPTRRDLASMQGLTRVAREFSAVRSTVNPDLRLLGVALFDFAAQDTRMLAEVRTMLEQRLSTIAPVFGTYVRQARRASTEMRRLGLLAHEYAEPDRKLPGSFAGLADDYRNLTAEILAEYRSRTAQPPADPWSRS